MPVSGGPFEGPEMARVAWYSLSLYWILRGLIWSSAAARVVLQPTDSHSAGPGLADEQGHRFAREASNGVLVLRRVLL